MKMEAMLFEEKLTFIEPGFGIEHATRRILRPSQINKPDQKGDTQQASQHRPE